MASTSFSPPVTLSSTLSLPRSCTSHTTNKIENLVEYSYIPESAQISESSYPLISPYQLYKRPSSLTRNIRTLISTRRPHPKEYIQSSRLDQCALQATSAEQYVTLEIPSELLSNWKREGYTHLHLGGIKLILTLHGRKGLPVTTRLTMLDTRFKQYQDAVIGTVLTTLHAGSVLLTFYPNFNLSLQDPNLPTTLKVQVQIQGAEQISSAKIATLHHQLVYRLQNHALDLPTPEHHSDTLMVLAESDQIPTIIQIPRQIPRNELIKLMPLEWISNYEQFHNNTTPIQTSKSMFERRQDGTVRMTFKPPPSAPQEPPWLSFTYSSMITAVQTAQEDLPITGFNFEGYLVYPTKQNGNFLWDALGSSMCDPTCLCWDDWDEDDDYATTRKRKPKKKKNLLSHVTTVIPNHHKILHLHQLHYPKLYQSLPWQIIHHFSDYQKPHWYSNFFQLDSKLRATLAQRYYGPEFDQKERENSKDNSPHPILFLTTSLSDISNKLLSFYPESHSEFTHLNPLWKRSHDEHRQLLTQFYDIVQSHGIMLSAKKSTIATDDIEFLSMIIKDGHYQPGKHNAQELLHFPNQQLSKKQVQQFLGIINYIRDFIPHVDYYTRHLSALLKKKPPEWNADHTNVVTTLKQIAQNPPPLKLITDGKRILQTDASDDSWGAILLEDINRKEHFITYVSGQFSETQKHYHGVFKEILAVKNGIKKFEYHLIGHHFLIRMDSSAFPNILNFKAVIDNEIQDVLHNYLCQLNHQPPPLKDIFHTSLGPQHDLLMITTPSTISKPKSTGIIIKAERPDYTDFLYQDSQDPWEDFLPLSQHLQQFPEPSMNEPGSSSQPPKADTATKPSKVDKATETSPRPGYQRDRPYPPCRGPHCKHPKLSNTFFPKYNRDTDPDETESSSEDDYMNLRSP
ncbi:hypothetical protein KPL70_001111 [Citrus sinensis]|nr:hypothetical protein KPL70_001111 [Citrus sinensis]